MKFRVVLHRRPVGESKTTYIEATEAVLEEVGTISPRTFTIKRTVEELKEFTVGSYFELRKVEQ